MNNEHYLHYVGDDDLEAADDHRLGGGDPADGLGHEDAAEDAEDCLLEAEQPGHPGPAAEQRHGVQTGHAHHGDGEPAHREPEHEDGVVEVAQLPRDDGHPGRQQRHRQREPEPHQVVRSLGDPGPRVPGLGHSQGEDRPSFITKHPPGPGPGPGPGAVVGRNQTKIGPVNRVTNLLADAAFSFRSNHSAPFNAVGPVYNAKSSQSQQMEALDNIRPEVWV